MLYLLCKPSGIQCHLPESSSEGWARWGSDAAGVEPNWEHHLLSFPVHHQRIVWMWQAHIHRSTRFPGTGIEWSYLLHCLFGEQPHCQIDYSPWDLATPFAIKQKREILHAENILIWTYSSLLFLKILMMNKDINPAELDFLLRYPVQPGVSSPVDFLSNHSWGGIKVHTEATHIIIVHCVQDANPISHHSRKNSDH